MRLILFAAFVFFLTTANAQDLDAKYADRVRTIDSTMETLYGTISGEVGQARDWDLFKYLFADEAWLIPSSTDSSGVVRYRHLKPADYVENLGPNLERNGFFETELHRVTEVFGNIAHVFSTYESRRHKNDAKPFARGINSIQLLYTGKRWAIINIYWSSESKNNPIPAKYLPR